MRICFAVIGVSGRHANMKRAFGMAPYLIAAGHEITICLQESTENQAAVDRIPGCKAVWFREASPLQERRQKSRLLREGNFDFIHFCGLGWRNALLPGLESARTIMEHTELESSFVGTSLVRRSTQWMLEWASLLCYSNSVVVSKYLEGLFRQRCRALAIQRNILYLPFAADTPVASCSEPDACKVWQAPGGRKLLIYMGNLYPAYGVFEILEALIQLRKLRSDWLFYYIGDGPGRAELERLTAASGLEEAVRFTGRLSEQQMGPYMNAATAFVSPLNDTITDWARCPGKTFIYMMFEKPIVTCEVGETMHALGEDGFYYKPGNVESMCAAIDRALDEPENWRPRYIKTDHTWAARASAYATWLATLPGK